MNKSEKLYIRISPEMKERLRVVASADGRTISNYVENLLKKVLAERE